MPSSLQVLLVVVVALASAATTSLRPEGDNGRHLGAERAPLPFPRDKAAYPATPLECFQVASPMNPNSSATGEGRFRRPHPRGAQNSSCTMVLMDHVFAHSYNHPFVGTSLRRPQRLALPHYSNCAEEELILVSGVQTTNSVRLRLWFCRVLQGNPQPHHRVRG